jgi:hypothetical protein
MVFDETVAGYCTNNMEYEQKLCGQKTEAGYKGLKSYCCLYKTKLTDVIRASHDVTILLRVKQSSYFNPVTSNDL